MDQELKKLMKELGEAINQAVAESDQISDVMSRIKAGGHDVFLVLEATIGFNRRDEDDEESSDEAAETEEPKRGFETTGKIKFTSQDHRFLRALKIAVDDENR